MAQESQWQRDAFAFACDLYHYLFKKRGMTQHLPPSILDFSGKSPYTVSIGKAILFLWHSFRDCHRIHLNSSHPEMAENSREFFQFVDAVCPGQVVHKGENIFLIVSDMSAQLFETCCYLLEKSHTSFLPLIPTAWSLVFGDYYKDRFFKSGGWEALKMESINCGIQYDMTAMVFPEGYPFTRKDIEGIFQYKLPNTVADFSSDPTVTIPLPDKLFETKPKQTKVKFAFQGRVPPLHPGLDLNTFPAAEIPGAGEDQNKYPSLEDIEDSCDEDESRMHPLHPGTELCNLAVTRNGVANGARTKVPSSGKSKETASSLDFEQNGARVSPLHLGLETTTSRELEDERELKVKSRNPRSTGSSETSCQTSDPTLPDLSALSVGDALTQITKQPNKGSESENEVSKNPGLETSKKYKKKRKKKSGR